MPKNHMFIHLTARLGWCGNFTQYATWYDEGLNKDLRDACKTAHQACFEGPVLWRMRQLLLQK